MTAPPPTVRFPEGAEHICTYLCNFGVDAMDLAVYLVRGVEGDSAWATMPAPESLIPGPDGPIGVMRYRGVLFHQMTASAPQEGSKVEAARRLLAQNIRGGSGAGYPAGFVAPGILDEAAYDDVVRELEEEYDARKARAFTERERARGAESDPILETADHLRLFPEPTQRARQAWKAQCPGGQHWLHLDSRTNLFHCGYCRRGGGPGDLREFVQEKRPRRG